MPRNLSGSRQCLGLIRKFLDRRRSNHVVGLVEQVEEPSFGLLQREENDGAIRARVLHVKVTTGAVAVRPGRAYRVIDLVPIRIEVLERWVERVDAEL